MKNEKMDLDLVALVMAQLFLFGNVVYLLTHI